MKNSRKIVIVQTTVSSRKEAQDLSAQILKKRLGACAHLIPIGSMYRWKGKKESAKEIMALIKTRKSLAARLIDFIKQRHPYELPEIIVTSVNAAEQGYAQWIFSETE